MARKEASEIQGLGSRFPTNTLSDRPVLSQSRASMTKPCPTTSHLLKVPPSQHCHLGNQASKIWTTKVQTTSNPSQQASNEPSSVLKVYPTKCIFLLSIIYSFIYLLSVLGLGLRNSLLPSRCFTTWATPPALFALASFQIGSHIFAQDWPQTTNCPISTYRIDGLQACTTVSSLQDALLKIALILV
jgi:hypothetical protein